MQRRRNRRASAESELLAYGWEALDLARGADDDELLVMTLKLLGDVVVTGGDPTTGLTLLARSRRTDGVPDRFLGSSDARESRPGGAPNSVAT